MNHKVGEAAKAGILGGGIGGVMSFLVNYYILTQPETLFDIAAGNGMSGLISGFMGGFMGLFMYIHKAES